MVSKTILPSLLLFINLSLQAQQKVLPVTSSNPVFPRWYADPEEIYNVNIRLRALTLCFKIIKTTSKKLP